MILDGKKVREEKLLEIKKVIEENNYHLTLAIIYVGNNSASDMYIKNKMKYASMCNINTNLYHLENVSEEDVINLIKKLNDKKEINGIILQSPVPEDINIENCIKYIDPSKDVDGFTNKNFYNLAHNINGLEPCTPKGIMTLLDYYEIPVKSKKVCIIGKGNIVGKPLIFEFLNRGATVISCNSNTVNLKELTLISDIIVACAGVKHLVTSDMVKKNAVVIDVGISIIDGKTYGDVDFENVKEIASFISPNPGGVGPMTILSILENVLKTKEGR